MLVFHYVAHTLKDVPLFDMTMDDDSEVSDEEDSLAVNDSGNGAIYNDFDIDPQTALFQEDAEEFSYSQTTNVKPSNTTAANASIQEAVDHAVMAEDRSVGVNYEHLSWETELFDNVSDSCDEAYCEKVYKLVTNEEGCWDKLAVSDEAMCMFQRRNRTKWDLPDTVYDAWMILNGLEREFFDYHLFFALLYPDLVDIAIDKVAKNQEVVPEDPIPSYQRTKRVLHGAAPRTNLNRKRSLLMSSVHDFQPHLRQVTQAAIQAIRATQVTQAIQVLKNRGLQTVLLQEKGHTNTS